MVGSVGFGLVGLHLKNYLMVSCLLSLAIGSARLQMSKNENTEIKGTINTLTQNQIVSEANMKSCSPVPPRFYSLVGHL
jgi:hypothetical protein